VEELQNQLRSDLLTENPAVGISASAPLRLRPDHYKGMSPEQLTEIVRIQQRQREESANAKAAEKAHETQMDAMMEYHRQQGELMEAQVSMLRFEARKKLLEENEELDKAQYAKNAFLDKQVFANAIDQQFFSQFGTSSR